jgi:hypothetical protein
MRISNAAGDIDIIPLTVRLKWLALSKAGTNVIRSIPRSSCSALFFDCDGY